MKRILSIGLVIMLVCSFMVGVAATSISAGNSPNHHLMCWPTTSVCDMTTCTAYQIWECSDGTTYLVSLGSCC